MIEKQTRQRIWRCTFVHRDGYNAPSFYVETDLPDFDKAKIAAIVAAKQRSRLADFPKVWSVKVGYMSKEIKK